MPTLQTSFTLCELHDRVRGDLGLRGSNFLTDDDITAWSEQIIRRSAQECHWYRTSTTADTTSGTAEYDIPAGVIAIEAVWHDDLPLTPINFTDLLASDPDWLQTSAGTPGFYYLRGATKYGLYPKPGTTESGVVRLDYTGIPAMPATGADTFDFPTANEQLIVSYCCYRASLKDASGEGGRRVPIYQQEYLQELARFKEAVSDFAEDEAVIVGSYATTPAWRDVLSHRTIAAPGAE